jgi:GT2 family glycosyltransferase
VKKLSVVIVSYNSAHLLGQMFEAINISSKGIDVEYIVIDNASRDCSADRIIELKPDSQLVKNQTNVGFGRANNQALPYINSEYILLLNTDAFVSPDTLHKTLTFMDAHPACGLLGVRLTDRDGSLQPSARYFPNPINLFLQRTGLSKLTPRIRLVDDMTWDHRSVRECDWVPGCYLLIRKEVLNDIGLFDPRYFLYYEEVDFCFAAKRAGWQVVYYPDTSVIHIGGESAKSEGQISQGGRQLVALQIESELLYIRKNHGLIALLAHLALSLIAEFIQALRSMRHHKFRYAFTTITTRVRLLMKLTLATKIGTSNTR